MGRQRSLPLRAVWCPSGEAGRSHKASLLELVQRRDSHGGNKTNIYRLTSLAEKAKTFAVELLDEHDARKHKSERQRRKRRVLRVLRSDKT
jgi:hypothetical protein